MQFFNRYNFLDKSVGISSLFGISSDPQADDACHIVEAQQAVGVPGIEGLVIPSGTRGRVLRVVGQNTALVRWEVSCPNIITLICFSKCLL